MGYKFRGCTIPDYMMGGVKRYVEKGITPGHFLTAVICNDLSEAVSRAIGDNVKNIAAYMGYFHNEAPMGCWGSKKKMDNWIKEHREERGK